MKNIAKELYPDCWHEDSEWFESPYDYQPIIEHFGEPVIQVDDKAYQGDSRVLLKENGEYGLLIFGWGSCSGCDALQACRSYDEVNGLINRLENDIKWFGDPIDCLQYVISKDWELSWAWHIEETKDFIKKVIKFLKEELDNE